MATRAGRETGRA